MSSEQSDVRESECGRRKKARLARPKSVSFQRDSSKFERRSASRVAACQRESDRVTTFLTDAVGHRSAERSGAHVRNHTRCSRIHHVPSDHSDREGEGQLSPDQTTRLLGSAARRDFCISLWRRPRCTPTSVNWPALPISSLAGSVLGSARCPLPGHDELTRHSQPPWRRSIPCAPL
jgi:hypothetical protein